MKRNLLFIAPCFHSYENFIIEELKKKGFNVFFFPERDYSLMFQIVNHISGKLLNIKQAKHYNKIFNSISNIKFDYLFIIRGYKITDEFLYKFKQHNPQSKLIMYQWDSNTTNPFKHIIHHFDKVYSFDFKDCKDLSLNYLPLFYTYDVCNYSFNKELASDFFFMGTFIPERYNALVKFKKYISNKKYKLNHFIYIKKTSLLKEYIKGRKIDLTLISTRHMNRDVYLSFLASTRIVVDVSSNGQTGLAMRIIEALTRKKKIITSNKYIKDEPYYNSNNILVYDTNNPSIPEDFINSPFEGNINTLSLSKWIDVMIQ